MTNETSVKLRSALEIALEKHERYQDLTALRLEIEEHIALLEECWNSIRPAEHDPADFGDISRLAA